MMDVPIEKAVGKLQEHIARLTWELAMTQAALEEALNGKRPGTSERETDEEASGSEGL